MKEPFLLAELVVSGMRRFLPGEEGASAWIIE
jgi:hypothetical protein